MLLYHTHAEAVHGMKYSWLRERMEKEAKESFDHAVKVRKALGYLGALPPPRLNFPAISQTSDVRKMLEEELKNEQTAAKQYKKIMPMVREDTYLYHEVYHILNSEMESAVELSMILEE
jgi:bacterioferritin (cytochrome b1)